MNSGRNHGFKKQKWWKELRLQKKESEEEITAPERINYGRTHGSGKVKLWKKLRLQKINYGINHGSRKDKLWKKSRLQKIKIVEEITAPVKINCGRNNGSSSSRAVIRVAGATDAGLRSPP